MAIGDGGVVGLDFDVGRLRIDGNRDGVAFEIGFDGEVTEELDGEYPRFEGAILSADQDAAIPGYGERLRGLGGAVDRQTGLGEREWGDLASDVCGEYKDGDRNEKLA